MLGSFLQQTTSADDIFRCIFLLGVFRVKPSCLDDADTPEKLLRMNIEDSSNHLTYSKIDIGFFNAEAKLKEAKVSERQVMECRVQC